MDVCSQAYGFTWMRECAVRGLLSKPDKLDLLLFLKGVGSKLPLSPKDRELCNLASDSELLFESGSNGSCSPQPLKALSLYRVPSASPW